MLTRRNLLAGLTLAVALSAAGAANAADKAPFTQVAFEAAQKAGKPMLIEVTAPWCPVCKAQKPILSELTAAPKFKNLAIFEVDYDSQKDVLKILNVQKQSTLISFKGGKEVGRSTGDTNKSSIASLLDKAI